VLQVRGTTGMSDKEKPIEEEKTHDILCGCGWGLLAWPSPPPDECPVCGYSWIITKKDVFFGNDEEEE